MKKQRSTSQQSLHLALSLSAVCLTFACAKKVDDLRQKQDSIAKQEIEAIPDVSTPVHRSSIPSEAQGSFNLSELEANAPFDLVSYKLTSEAYQAGLAVNPTSPLTGNFREWYSAAIEPEQSKSFSISCTETQTTSQPRIVLAQLIELNPVKFVELVAFRIGRCNKVQFDLGNLTDGKSYGLNARVYEYIRDRKDPESSLFDTRLLLEGSTMAFSKASTSPIVIDYRRVPEESAEKIDLKVSQGGQDELDVLRGKSLTLTLAAADPTKPNFVTSTPAPSVRLVLRNETSGQAVEVITDASGVAKAKDLAAGFWRVLVPEYKGIANLVYPTLTDRILVTANQDFSKTIVLKPEVYTWLFKTEVRVDNFLQLDVSITAAINEKPDAKGSHLGFAYPAFLKHCEAMVRAQTSFVYAKQAADAMKAIAITNDESRTQFYKYLAADGKRLIKSTTSGYLATSGVQVNLPAQASAPWGAGDCRLGPAL